MNAVTKELPEGWQLVPLGTLRGGTAKSINPSDQPDEIYDLYSIPSYSEGIPEVVTGKEIGSSKRIVEPNTVLLSKINPRINRVWIVGSASKHKQISSPEWIEFFPIDGIEPKYIMYFMQNYKFREHLSMNVTGVGGSLTRIRPKIAEDYEIPLAPPEQQKRIVTKIEELFTHIDAGIASLQAAKKLLKQYRQSVLKAAVTGELTKDWRKANKDKLEPASKLLERILIERRQRWEEQQLEKFEAKGKIPKDDKWKEKYKEPKSPAVLADLLNPVEWVLVSIDQVAEIFLGKMLDKAKHTTGERLPYLRNINVRWGSINTDDLMEMFFKDSELKRYDVRQGDVLVCEGGEPGRAAVWRGDINMKYQKALHRIRFYLPLVPQYLVYLLEYFATTGLLQRYFTGSTIKHLTKESLITFPFPLPPLPEIEQIVFEIDEKSRSIRRLEDELDFQLLKAAKNKQSILTSAFTGVL